MAAICGVLSLLSVILSAQPPNLIWHIRPVPGQRWEENPSTLHITVATISHFLTADMQRCCPCCCRLNVRSSVSHRGSATRSCSQTWRQHKRCAPLKIFDWLETRSPVKLWGKPPLRSDVRISRTSVASYVTARTSSRPADNDTTISVNHPSNKSRQSHHTLKNELRRI